MCRCRTRRSLAKGLLQILAICFLPALAGCSNLPGARGSQPAAPASTSAVPLTVQATPSPATQNPAGKSGAALSYSGDVRARAQISLTSKISGRIEELKVGVGDQVHAGDVVAVLEHSALDAQVAQAEAALEAAQSNLAKLKAGPRQEQVALAAANLKAAQARLDLLKKTPFADQIQTAELNLQRAKDALAQAQSMRDSTCGSGKGDKNKAVGNACTAADAAVGEASDGVQTAQVQLDQTKAGPRAQDIAQAEAAVTAAAESYRLAQSPYTDQDIAAAQAQVDAAEAAVEMARLNRDEAFIKAPVDGVVSSRAGVIGAMAGGTSPAVMNLVSEDVQIVIAVEESASGRIKVGQPATITVAAYPDQTFTGKVGLISPIADPVARTFEVTVYPDDPGHKLRPGMFADVVLSSD